MDEISHDEDVLKDAMADINEDWRLEQLDELEWLFELGDEGPRTANHLGG